MFDARFGIETQYANPNSKIATLCKLINMLCELTNTRLSYGLSVVLFVLAQMPCEKRTQ